MTMALPKLPLRKIMLWGLRATIWLSCLFVGTILYLSCCRVVDLRVAGELLIVPSSILYCLARVR